MRFFIFYSSLFAAIFFSINALGEPSKELQLENPIKKNSSVIGELKDGVLLTLENYYQYKGILDGANFSGADLSEANFSGANLSEANLSMVNMVGANLSAANLWKANLSEAELETANLSEADLKKANLFKVNLVEANLSKTNLTEVNLEKANLIGANLTGANLEKANLIGADLSGAYLIGANLKDADLSGADLTEANLEKADLTNAQLEGAKLRKARLHRAELSYANLTNANLTWAIMSDANLLSAQLYKSKLDFADLSRTRLFNAYLSNASLYSTKLIEADLEEADLTEANMQLADLSKAGLISAYLSEANLSDANLTEANLYMANLSEAKLKETNLFNANMSETSLAKTLYEPKINTLPNLISVSKAFSLNTMWYDKSPTALEELKRAFKNAGLRQQEREITHAIKQSDQRINLENKNYLEFIFNYLFFDLTIDFGLNPGKALRWLVYLIPIFAFFYVFAIWKSIANHCIYRIWPKERIQIEHGEVAITEVAKIDRLPKGRLMLLEGFYFSLLSAFHIGWRELNVGNWISRLQFQPYTYYATGWVRTVSGIQSLISVLLLAMWALSYFGRPFD